MSDLESLPGEESLPSDDQSLPSPPSGSTLREESDNDENGPIVEARFMDSPGHEALPDASSCCAQDCANTVAAEQPEALQEWHKLAAKLSNDELNDFLYTLLMGMPANSKR